jgi:Zn-dependent protease/CBS domain-containing protein
VRSSLTLGRIKGIVVGVNWSVIVIVVFVAVGLAVDRFPNDAPGYTTGVYWFAAIVTGILLVVSILVHELAHSLVAVRSGVEVDSITLWALGGVSRLKGTAKSPRDEFEIAVVGPLTSLAIGILSGAVALVLDAASSSRLAVSVFAWFAGINVILAVFNLIPAAPLDGGRVLSAAVWAATKDRLRATQVAAGAGRLFGALLIAFGVLLFLSSGAGGLWYVLLGWFLINAAGAEEQYGRMERALASVRVRDLMSPHPVTAPADLDLERFIDEYVMRNRYSAFPVVDHAGRVQGLLTLRRAKHVPRAHWRSTLVADVACPMDKVPTASPEEPVLDAMRRMDDDCAEGRVLVMEDGMLVGLLSPSDIRRSFELAELRQHAGAR